MATGDDGDDTAHAQTTPGAASTRGMSETTNGPGWEATSPGAVIAPKTVAGDESMLREGDAVARYRVEGYLGRGGMGVVYRARDPDLDRALAIKLVRSRHRGGDRMLREAQAMARLDHANVVPIFDVGMRGQQVFLVMPFLSGGTLGDWCAAEARPWQEVVRRYIAAGRGLEAAHRAGIVHRDFKPDNVLLTAKGYVQVADFGIARADRDGNADVPPDAATSGGLGHPLTRAGQVLGTPAYMAPEQLDGKPVDAKADQFSFCVALHEGLYGVRPFELPPNGSVTDLRRALAADRIRPAENGRDVPARIREVLVRGLRHDAAARWPSMTAVLDELERSLRRKRPAAQYVVAALVAAAATAGVVALATRDSATPAPRSTTPPQPAASVPVFTPRQLTFRGDLKTGTLAPDDSAILARAGDDLIAIPLRPDGQPKTVLKGARDVASFAWSPDATHAMTVTRIVDGRSLVRMIDVASGEREERELPVFTVATLVEPRAIASTLSNHKSVRFTPLDPSAAPTTCPVPGEYLWMKSLHAEAGALFVTVQHADETYSVVRTDRQCTAPRVILDHVSGRGFVTVDHDGTHVGILRDIFGSLVLERYPAAGGQSTRSPPLPFDVTAVAGRTASGDVVLTRATATWTLARLDGEPARVTDILGAGSNEVELQVAPDGTRVARRGERQQMDTSVVPIDQLDALAEPIAPGLRHMAWSPDGTRVAGLLGGAKDAEVVIASVTGGPLEYLRLTSPPSGDFVWIDDQHLAYRRKDNRTFVSFDLRTRRTVELFDPDLGWTFGLSVNRHDGSLAVYWNSGRGPGVYIVRPGKTPERVTPEGDAVRFPAWSADGRALWMFEFRGGTIDRYDIVTRTRTRTFESTEPGTTIGGIWPQSDGHLVVKLSRVNADLVVYE